MIADAERVARLVIWWRIVPGRKLLTTGRKRTERDERKRNRRSRRKEIVETVEIVEIVENRSKERRDKWSKSRRQRRLQLYKRNQEMLNQLLQVTIISLHLCCMTM